MKFRSCLSLLYVCTIGVSGALATNCFKEVPSGQTACGASAPNTGTCGGMPCDGFYITNDALNNIGGGTTGPTFGLTTAWCQIQNRGCFTLPDGTVECRASGVVSFSATTLAVQRGACPNSPPVTP